MQLHNKKNQYISKEQTFETEHKKFDQNTCLCRHIPKMTLDKYLLQSSMKVPTTRFKRSSHLPNLHIFSSYVDDQQQITLIFYFRNMVTFSRGSMPLLINSKMQTSPTFKLLSLANWLQARLRRAFIDLQQDLTDHIVPSEIFKLTFL